MKRRPIFTTEDTHAAEEWFNQMLDETIRTEVSDADRLNRLERDYSKVYAMTARLDRLEAENRELAAQVNALETYIDSMDAAALEPTA